MEHYESAEDYLLAIPRHSPRLRLAVLWPILIGLATLARLAGNENWLNPAYPSRVSRRWIYFTLVLSLPVVVSNTALKFWIKRLRNQIIKAI
jgi:farnesyl-diphosphate farnesyltransferase